MRQCWENYFDVGDEEDVIRFAKSIRTKNPLHLDNQVARQNKLLGVVVPGVMIVGFADATITEEVDEVKIRRLDVDFVNPLYAGSVVSVLCTVLYKKLDVAKIAIVIKNGFETIAEGSCFLMLSQKST